MALVTLRELRRRARAKADMLLYNDIDGGSEPSYANDFIPNEEINEHINVFAKEYYNLICQAEGEDYFRAKAIQTINSTTRILPLPYDFYKLRGIDYVQTPDNISKTFTGSSTYVSTTMDSITINRHRLHHGASCTLSNSGGALPTGISAATTYYIFVCSENIIKLCTSLENLYDQTFVDISATGSGTNTISAQSSGSYRTAVPRANEDEMRNYSLSIPSIVVELSYTPTLRKLIDTVTDPVTQQTTIDGINGLEEYIVLRAAIYMKGKQEESPDLLVSEFKEVKTILESLKEDRDSGQADCVRDIRSEGPNTSVSYRIRGASVEFVNSSSFGLFSSGTSYPILLNGYS